MSKEERIVDAKTGGQKGQKEERFDLIPFDALEEVARVYGRGAKKYAEDNWLKGYRWRLSAGAMLRHVAKFMLGEHRVPPAPPTEPPDPTEGCHHLACAAWHCLTLITFDLRKLGTDDRAPPAPAPSPAKPAADLFPELSLPPPGWRPVKFLHGEACDDPNCAAPSHFE